MTSELKRILSELQGGLRGVYGTRLAEMILYGSQARGDAGEDADIDVLVVLHGEVSPSLEVARTSEIVADVSLRHGVVISCLFMDEERYLYRSGPLLRNIRREGVRL